MLNITRDQSAALNMVAYAAPEFDFFLLFSIMFSSRIVIPSGQCEKNQKKPLLHYVSGV